ncbi:hypothetical protein ACS0TY_021775 [Phlomoides rotata]
MSSNETIDQFDNRCTAIINEINDLGKEYTNKEIVLKILRALPKKWRTKRTIIKDTKDLNKLTPSQLFSMLKAYEFDLSYDDEAEPTTPTTSKSVAFKASKSESSKKSECRSEGQKEKGQVVQQVKEASDMSVQETMALILKRFDKMSNKYGKYKKFNRDAQTRGRDSRKSSSYSDQKHKSRSPDRSSRKQESSSKKEAEERPNACYNCGKVGHYAHECPELTSKQREERQARRERRYAERKEMVAGIDPTDLPSSSSSSSGYSTDGEVGLMAFEEDEVTSLPSGSSASSPSFSVTHELSLSTVNKDLQLTIEQLIDDLRVATEAYTIVENENSKLRAENSKRLESENETDLRSATLVVELSNELSTLKDSYAKQEELLKAQLHDQGFQAKEFKALQAKFDDLFSRHELLKRVRIA